MTKQEKLKKLREYNRGYEAKNREKRRSQKLKWWRTNRGKLKDIPTMKLSTGQDLSSI